MKSKLKPPGTKRLNQNTMNRFQLVLSNSTCAATTRERASQSGTRRRPDRAEEPRKMRVISRAMPGPEVTPTLGVGPGQGAKWIATPPWLVHCRHRSLD